MPRKRTQGSVDEITTEAGQARSGVKAMAETGLMPMQDGAMPTADVIAALQERVKLDRDPRVLDYIAALGVRMRRHEQVLQLLMRALELHALEIELSDEHLQALYDGARRYSTWKASTTSIDQMVDVLLCLDDRAIRRMEEIIPEPRPWRYVSLWTQDMLSWLEARLEPAVDFQARSLYNDLVRAYDHFQAHLMLILAVNDPNADPHQVLTELTTKTAKVYPIPRGKRDKRNPLNSLHILLDSVQKELRKLPDPD